MVRRITSEESELLAQAGHRMTSDASDLAPLMEMIGDARYVLIGEASHGTYEFCTRAEITKQLIREKGFRAVIVEADWPDAYRVNRFVRGVDEDGDANSALGGFTRFPTWMWRNADVLDFVGWLRDHNDSIGRGPQPGKCGFYGMDLYGMHGSMAEVVKYLDQVDPEAAKRARERYACFDHADEDPQRYGYAAEFGMGRSCEDKAVEQLLELRRAASEYAKQDGQCPEDEAFYAEQNARLVVNAERYYRSMFGGRVSSWNLRDTHMVETIESLVKHLERSRPRTKVVVWAHNSHFGDARATEMGEGGETNVGQMIRERHGGESVLIGFSTFGGTVTAATDWDGPPERKTVRPGLSGSHEATLHDAWGGGDGLMILRDNAVARQLLARPRLERAIGVIYRPETERMSHYFHARLPEQFDAVIHIDHTRAVEPLEHTAGWTRGELPETFPTGV